MRRRVENRRTQDPSSLASRIDRWGWHLVGSVVAVGIIGAAVGGGIAKEFSNLRSGVNPEAADGSTRATCASPAWGQPLQAAPPGHEQRVARDPRLAFGKRHSYIVGVDIQTFGPDRVPESPLTAWEIGRRDIGRPFGRFAFLFPRGAVDAHDRLHLFWAEPRVLGSNIDGSTWAGLLPAGIWTATYDAVSGWSTPRELPLESEQPRWWWTGVADNLGDAGLEQGIGLPPRRPSRSLPYLALGQDGSWRRTTLPAPGAYATAASDSNRIVVAYAAADSAWAASPANPTHEDANSVFVRTSTDGGVIWSAPTMVQRGGSAPAHEVKVLLGKEGEVHLLWIQATPVGAAIRHVVSPDGVRWPTPDDLPAPSQKNMRALRPGTTRGGRLGGWRGSHSPRRGHMGPGLVGASAALYRSGSHDA
jgi:hypothetical protein